MSLSVGNVTISDGYKATYAASWAAFTPAVGAVFTISGSATKTIKVLRIGFSATQTTAGTATFGLNSLTSITGGTPVAPTGIVPFDSASPAATATPVIYTAAPTPGDTKFIKQVRFIVPIPAVVRAEQNEYIFGFTNPTNQTFILNGTSEIVSLNINAVAAGFVMSVWVEWTEE